MVDNVGSLVADVLGAVLLQHSQYDTINTVNRDRHEQGEEDVDQFSVVSQLAQQHSQYGVISRQDEEEEDEVSVISLVIASLVGSVAGQLLVFLFGNDVLGSWQMRLKFSCQKTNFLAAKAAL